MGVSFAYGFESALMCYMLADFLFSMLFFFQIKKVSSKYLLWLINFNHQNNWNFGCRISSNIRRTEKIVASHFRWFLIASRSRVPAYQQDQFLNLSHFETLAARSLVLSKNLPNFDSLQNASKDSLIKKTKVGKDSRTIFRISVYK